MREPIGCSLTILALLAGGLTACSNKELVDKEPTPTASIPEAAVPAPPATGSALMPHGDHNPHFGGIVMMNGDLHFEVVLRPSGHYNVYFSDAARTELPASMASEVTIVVTRAGESPERVPLQIDDAGESWIGAGRPVDRLDATARVAYTFQGKPYWIDLPFAVGQTKPNPPQQ